MKLDIDTLKFCAELAAHQHGGAEASKEIWKIYWRHHTYNGRRRDVMFPTWTGIVITSVEHP